MHLKRKRIQRTVNNISKSLTMEEPKMSIKQKIFCYIYFKLGLYYSYSIVCRGNFSDIKAVYVGYKAGFLDINDLRLFVQKWEKISEKDKKYFKEIKSLVSFNYLLSNCGDQDKLLIQNNWSGLKEYLESFGLRNFVSSLPWQLISTDCNQKQLYKHLVSIIIPTFNAQKTIKTTLQSLFNQSYRNIEIIVVNDGSTDQTKAIIEQMSKFDPRLKLINLKNNQGAYIARNIGAKASHGDFICIHDSDDIAHPDKILIQVSELIKNFQLKGSISYWVRFSERGILSLHRGLPILRLNLSSLMIRRELLEELGDWVPNYVGSDLEFFNRVQAKYGKESILKIRKPLSIGLFRLDSLTTQTRTSVFNLEGRQHRMKFEELWRRQHIKSFNPILYQILSLLERLFPLINKYSK